MWSDLFPPHSSSSPILGEGMDSQLTFVTIPLPHPVLICSALTEFRSLPLRVFRSICYSDSLCFIRPQIRSRTREVFHTSFSPGKRDVYCGILTQNSVLIFSSLVTTISPPWATVICCERYKPKPVPTFLSFFAAE